MSPTSYLTAPPRTNSITRFSLSANRLYSTGRNFAWLAENWLNSHGTRIGTTAGKFARYELALKGRSVVGKTVSYGLEPPQRAGTTPKRKGGVAVPSRRRRTARADRAKLVIGCADAGQEFGQGSVPLAGDFEGREGITPKELGVAQSKG